MLLRYKVRGFWFVLIIISLFFLPTRFLESPWRGLRHVLRESKFSLTHGYCLVYTSSNSMESFLFIVSWIISSGNTRKLRYLTKISKYLRSGPACARTHIHVCTHTGKTKPKEACASARAQHALCPRPSQAAPSSLVSRLCLLECATCSPGNRREERMLLSGFLL